MGEISVAVAPAWRGSGCRRRQLRTPSPGRGVTMYVEKPAATGLTSAARTQENFTTARGRDTASPVAWLLSLKPLGARPELLPLQRNPSRGDDPICMQCVWSCFVQK